MRRITPTRHTDKREPLKADPLNAIELLDSAREFILKAKVGGWGRESKAWTEFGENIESVGCVGYKYPKDTLRGYHVCNFCRVG